VGAAAPAGEGRAQHVTGWGAGGGSCGPASGGRSGLARLLAQLVETSDPPAREAGHDPTIRPMAEPLAAAALDQEEEEMPGRARA
jgi:hypothetical protein